MLIPNRCSTVLVAAIALAGCANPAADKPAAEVRPAAGQPAAPAPAGPPAADYSFGHDGSTIGFVGSKVTGSHDGGFRAFAGKIQLAPGQPARAGIKLMIDARSLWADNERLTGHLKSPDFFDVEKFPTITFHSTEIVPAGDGYTIRGDLSLHGVTKNIAFPATVAIQPDRVTAKAEFSIKRFDFGLVYPGKADDLIRDDVLVKLDLVAVPDPHPRDLDAVLGLSEVPGA